MLAHLLLLGDLPAPRALAAARVGLRALSAHRQAPPVAHAAVAADLHQALDVLRALPAQVALDGQLAVDRLAQLDHLVVGQVLDVGVRRHAGLLEDLARTVERPTP